MFKKLLSMLFGIVLIGNVISARCIDLDFNDADVCFDIEKQDSNTFEVNTDITNTNGATAIICQLQLPDWVLKNVSANDCNTTFDYDDNDIWKIAGYISINGERLTFQEFYDFDNGEWDSYSSNDEDLDDFEFDGDTTPDDNKRETIKITAVNDNGSRIREYKFRLRTRCIFR